MSILQRRCLGSALIGASLAAAFLTRVTYNANVSGDSGTDQLMGWITAAPVLGVSLAPLVAAIRVFQVVTPHDRLAWKPSRNHEEMSARRSREKQDAFFRKFLL